MILGVTGAPGSGKSMLVRVMADRGWFVVDADRMGKAIVEESPDILDELAAVFGPDIIGPDRRLDRRLLARRAFATPEATRLLNRTVHPALVRRVVGVTESLRENGRDAVVDCALIFEWGIGDRFDRIVCVRADETLRRKRLADRDRRTPEEIDQLFSAQLPEDEKARRSHIVLANNGPMKDIAAYGLMLAELPRFTDEGKRWMEKSQENG